MKQVDGRSAHPRRKFVHELVMNFDGAFMNVHVNS